MKANATRRAVALVLAILMILGVAVVAWEVTANAAVENYAKGCSYTTSNANYLENKKDTGSLLTDGVIASAETNGVTVAYAGTEQTYTIIFDLGDVKYDIKTIKFMNVYVASNRDFGGDEVTISVAKTMEKVGDVTNTYTYETVVQSGTNYFNYVYSLSTEAIGRYVHITMYSPKYVISLSEIEIWGSGNPAVEDDEPVYINYASGNSYSASDVAYNTGFEDNGKLLTDGFVALTETPGKTVALVGSDKTYTYIFDLGATRDDIKTVKFRNVCVNGNRGFSADKVVIAATDSLDSSEPVTSTYTYVKEEQSGTIYFDFIYTLDKEAVGRYVYITINTPEYVLSLSEIEIWSEVQNNSAVIIPDPIDPTPKFDIVLSSVGNFKENQNFELLCTVKNITATYGIVAVDFVVSYNKAAFTPVYPSGNNLSSQYIKTAPKDGSTLLWEDIGTYCDTNAGKVYMRFAHKVAENGDGAKKDGELVFKIVFKPIVSSGTYKFTASSCKGTDPGSSNYKKLTEVYANGSSCSATAYVFTGELVPTVSGITIENGCVYGVKPGISSDELASMFEGTVNVTSNGISEKVGTGYKVAVAGGEEAIIVIRGDVDGSGSIDSTDYISVKKHILRQKIISGEYLLAADTDASGKIDATDYLKIKSHFLGSSSLY